MPVRLYLDKDSLNRRVTAELRRLGLDVLTTSEVANDELADDLQLQFATGQGRAIYTANVADFARIHAE